MRWHVNWARPAQMKNARKLVGIRVIYFFNVQKCIYHNCCLLNFHWIYSEQKIIYASRCICPSFSKLKILQFCIQNNILIFWQYAVTFERHNKISTRRKSSWKYYFSLRNICEVKHSHICKVVTTNPSHWLYLCYIIHVQAITRDTGCH